MRRIRYLRLTGRQRRWVWLWLTVLLVTGLCCAAVLHMRPIIVSLATARVSNAVNRIVVDAVRDAIGNAKHNGVKNARFFAADATAWIREAADAGQKADVVFMDPPREGSTPAFIESVARMAPKRVVYVSCNPETMARDLALLTQKGYRAEGFTPVDMFPHSTHCEVVGSLVRVK